MATLPERLDRKVEAWRKAGYPSAYPALVAILEYQRLDDHNLRYLRPPQVAALETYWYLRARAGTPTIPDLYRHLYSDPAEMLDALGVPKTLSRPLIDILGAEASSQLLDKIYTDADFVRTHHLEALQETLRLDYPSYILALAMGAGKTTLIAAIIATEFALALEYPSGPFVQNALVFAPGKTILNALREMAEVPYNRLLPPRHFTAFNTNLKLTFTRDGEKDLPVIAGSTFNLIVTNTEKIRLQAAPVRRRRLSQLELEREEQKSQLIANLRLRKLASLPHLGIFSDEAHHTYGNSLEKGLKRVRQTVNYLAQETNVTVVINTTGTPFYKKQLLKDIVIWYGLKQGIEDDILKDFSGSVKSYSLDVTDDESILRDIVKDFFQHFRTVRLPDGAPARLAMYFPGIGALKKARPIIESEMLARGINSPVLESHNKASDAENKTFDRIGRTPGLPHRVILLVNKGTEGWNCPSLFATALVRQLKSSNNFVLQATTRCLRQVPGNTHHARIYITHDNRAILERELQDTYGLKLSDLASTQTELFTREAIVRKPDIPRFMVRQNIRRVVADEAAEVLPVRFIAPTVVREEGEALTLKTGERGELIAIDRETIAVDDSVALYHAAQHLSSLYRLGELPGGTLDVLRQLRAVYSSGRLPAFHLPLLEAQVQDRVRKYTVKIEKQVRALALIKPEGFDRAQRDGEEVFVTTIRYRRDRLEYLQSLQDAPNPEVASRASFHYDPYVTDSGPETDFLRQLLESLGQSAETIQDVLFTGGLRDTKKTDFFVEYEGEDGRWHRYYPDFFLRRKDGKAMIVEVKREDKRHDRIDGIDGVKAKAVQEWEQLNPDKIQYWMCFTPGDSILDSDILKVKQFFSAA